LFNVASGGRGEEDGGGAKSNDGEKAWSAINNSILSEVNISGQITAKSSALYILFTTVYKVLGTGDSTHNKMTYLPSFMLLSINYNDRTQQCSYTPSFQRRNVLF
jgi:hypothetical protein